MATWNNQQVLPPNHVTPPHPSFHILRAPSHQCLQRLNANLGQRLALLGIKPFHAAAAAPQPLGSFHPASTATKLPPRGAAAAPVPRPRSYRSDQGDQHGGGIVPQLTPPAGLLGDPLPPPAAAGIPLSPSGSLAAVARGHRATGNGRLVLFPEQPEGGQRPHGLRTTAAGVEALQESPAGSGTCPRSPPPGRVVDGGGGGKDEPSEDRRTRSANFHVCRVLRRVAVPERVRSIKKTRERVVADG